MLLYVSNMKENFGPLETMEYPGRFILIGRTDDDIVIAYGVTARSPSSKSKEYVLTPDESAIEVKAIDEAVLAQGDVELLKYTSFYFVRDNVVVGNGRQTESDTLQLEGLSAKSVLESSLRTWSYENDSYNTPRITGLLFKNNNEYTAALHIIRSDKDGVALRDVYEIPLASGCGKLITTYDGENVRPTPSYSGQPFDVQIFSPSPEALTQRLSEALTPRAGESDLRVSFMSVYQNIKTGKRRIYILNNR